MVDNTKVGLGPTTSRKPVFEKNHKTQRSYVPLCGHRLLVQSIPALTVTFIDKITIIYMYVM